MKGWAPPLRYQRLKGRGRRARVEGPGTGVGVGGPTRRGAQGVRSRGLWESRSPRAYKTPSRVRVHSSAGPGDRATGRTMDHEVRAEDAVAGARVRGGAALDPAIRRASAATVLISPRVHRGAGAVSGPRGPSRDPGPPSAGRGGGRLVASQRSGAGGAVSRGGAGRAVVSRGGV